MLARIRSATSWIVHEGGLRATLAALCLLACSSAELARAQEVPNRVLGAWSVGAPLRLTRNDQLGQEALAPVYADMLAGYLFAGSTLRHGFGLGLSLNLTKDGGFNEPVDPAQEFVLAPNYLLYGELGPDWFALGHVAVPFVLTGVTTAGLEVGGALGYRMLAGFGVFAELGFDAFVGVASRIHPAVSLELGAFLDYEVLP